jgi:hypothetical protein
LAFINTEIAVESWTGIAFANGNKEPAKGRQGGSEMPFTGTPGRAVIGSRGGVGLRAFQFAQITS